MAKNDYPHLFLRDIAQSLGYTNPAGGGGGFETPPRPDQRSHAEKIRHGLEQAWAQARNEADHRKAVSMPAREGTYIEFISAPDYKLKFESLEERGSGIRLLNVRDTIDEDGQEIQCATIYVPSGKEKILASKIENYREDVLKGDKARNTKLVESIDNLRSAVLQSFWYDPASLLPDDRNQIWCEVWLRVQNNANEVVPNFFKLCAKLGVETRDEQLSFPEREVVLIKASEDNLAVILASSDHIAEFRRAKETAAFWTEMPNFEQAEWATDLAKRLSVNPETDCSACVVDTGANNGHPLLAPLLNDEDRHTVNVNWGVSDSEGHGTRMCGTAAFADELGNLLQSSEPITLPFRLESSKLIPKSGHEPGGRLYGKRTQQAISRVEVQRPNMRRAVCLAITSEDDRDNGRPSSWSGAIDQLAAGVSGGPRRLMILAAGNVGDSSEWNRYPDANITNRVHDPAQAWNALTVGAVTFLDSIEDKDLASQYEPIAQYGQLSPYSTTSVSWDKKWPNKPDIVLEGGNAAKDAGEFTTVLEDLSLLSLHHRPQEALFASTNMTSAATGLATNMACQLMAQYPGAWPETIRALLVHSAQWTEELSAQFHVDNKSEKDNIKHLLRICGYGIPNFDRAMRSARNSLTLIAQEEIQPFEKMEGSNGFQAKDMHLFELPWPSEALAELPDKTLVRIDVTLSYFIEPGPGEIGWRDKYRYRSFGLDFNLKKPFETDGEFKARINKAARDPDGSNHGGSSVDWTIGLQSGRPRGSIHRDWVEMSAIDARSSNMIGVFPRSGWWKERHYLGRGADKGRYSLVVSLSTDETEVDIYTPVATKIAPETAISS